MIGSGYTISRKPSITPGRPSGGPRTVVCKWCKRSFTAESENDAYCRMGCADASKRARSLGKTRRRKHKVLTRRFYSGQWQETLACGHSRLVPISKGEPTYRCCPECCLEKP